MTSHWFSIVTLLAAVLIGYAVIANRNSDDLENTSDRPVVLGYYLKNAIITETSESGAPRLRFAADEVTQNPQDNSVSLETVRIDYLWSKDAQTTSKQTTSKQNRQNQTPAIQPPVIQPSNIQPSNIQHWVLNANHAVVPAKSQQIALTGDVEAHNVGGSHETMLTTQALTVDTAKEIALSPQRVDVNVDGHLLSGEGLTVDLRKQHVQLHSDVQVRLAANTHKDNGSNDSAAPISLPGVFYSESSDYSDNVLTLKKVRSKVEPLIEADQARANGKDLENNQIVLSGNVHLKLPQKGSLSAAVATVTVKQSSIDHVHVTGDPVKFEHQPQNSQQVAHGHAKAIDYDVPSQMLRFFGDASFAHGDFELNAERIDYDLATDHARGMDNTFRIKPTSNNGEAIVPKTP